MRELTQKEIDNAPEWATHYDAAGATIMFESKDFTQIMIKGELGNLIPFGPVSAHSILIPRKPFHISDTWHSSTYNILDNGSIELVDDPTLDRDQVIDLARHFNIKEDL